MNRYWYVLALALLLGPMSEAMADEATLGWDHSGVGITGYRVYLDDTMLQEVTVKTAVVTLPPDGGMFSVSAYNETAESARSEPIGIPAAPTNITLTITFGG